MLCLQIATSAGPIVPAVALVTHEHRAAIPVALSVDAAWPVERLIARLQSAQRVRALHATVLRRIESFAAQGGKLPELPVGDALKDATVLIAGRGPLYPALSVAIGEQVNMVGGLSVETAAKYLAARDIDGIVVGDGFSPRMVEAFLTLLVQDTRFRDMPVAVIGETLPAVAEGLPHIDIADGDPARLVARMVPAVRLHAFEARLKRMLRSLEADGMFDPETGLLSRDAFWRELARAIAEAADRGAALSIARFSFEGVLDGRLSSDSARLVTRFIRNIDFATREDETAILVVFTQTSLRSAHVVARRIAGALKAMLAPARPREQITAHVTLATLKAGDTLDSLMLRMIDSRVVAAE